MLVLALASSVNASESFTRGDANLDGTVTIADVTMLISRVLTNQWPEGGVPADIVDLGLPSGTLWATHNVGAVNPEDYGDYFAWAETVPNKENYAWASTAYAYYEYNENGQSQLRFSKYNTDSQYGEIDNLTELEPEDDAAYVNMGSSWRMPTGAQIDELLTKCTWQWTEVNGVKGRMLTGPNGNTMFLPAAGQRSGANLSNVGSIGRYWSRDMYAVSSSFRPNSAFIIYFSSGIKQKGNATRNYGYPVRPVYVSDEILVDDIERGDVNLDGTVSIADVTMLIGYVLTNQWPAVDPIEEYVDLGLPSGTLWATYNVGATKPEEAGDYFAWGETAPKEYYVWDNTQWLYSENGMKRISKYNTKSQYGDVDNLIELELEDDAAYVNRGPEWRMPSKEQIDELIANCTWEWTELNGVKGQLITGPNGNTMFLPAAGYHLEGDLSGFGTNGSYWTRSLHVVNETVSFPTGAYKLYIFDNEVQWNTADRPCGYPVRAVRVSQD